ncbi:hypothetical protein HMPREF1981_01353 [Bacteroides pyogenes F0041]|uniref:Uncharacterized protein n=1 Tax=Bacteroides pyogenes F0041 TaxID=1321819 RepID=U2E0L6_9BACE|nr:hypothetical protein HMPREF1981_01353 [Bacteroides pyogenes F0041]
MAYGAIRLYNLEYSSFIDIRENDCRVERKKDELKENIEKNRNYG